MITIIETTDTNELNIHGTSYMISEEVKDKIIELDFYVNDMNEEEGYYYYELVTTPEKEIIIEVKIRNMLGIQNKQRRKQYVR